ncbi:DUF2182 domain-containing protein [Sulfitobacter aestuarii]|uniref:DUF2182 domain-containing protein n=1 Tax=Sulfitobacter aestuarii TaxID=2161676 RepID=A0ABW5U5K0_9RHOB
MNSVLRSTLWLGFFGAVLAAWWLLYAMAMQMDLDLLGRPGAMAERMRWMDPGMDMDMPIARFGPLFAMWAVMMAAMMLPSLVPTLRAYEDLIASANGSRGGWLGVLSGYGLIWLIFAAVITVLQLLLLHGGVIDMLGIARSRWLAAALLASVGLYQFSRAKQVCHGVCHAPMMYFLGHWRAGFAGGLRMGAWLGAFCAGCCWGFMLLGFAGGVMNLAWMGLATLFMVLEKLPQIGGHVIKPMGLALILGAFVVAGWPFLTGG